MSRALAEWAGAKLAAHSDRRGFLARSALAGTAIATVPKKYILQPETAYAAVCNCSGSRCGCGSLCCDGYTEFCCTTTGANRCPAGTVAAGWWKVDASGFCVDGAGRPGPRYYVDCNAQPASPCNRRGVTSQGQGCSCGCAQGNCANRKQCCTAFRYGQCNQQIPCLGPIVCRVVTCAPPWTWEQTCRTTPATDNATRFHHRPCLEEDAPGSVFTVSLASLPVVVRAGTWYFARNSSTEGLPRSIGFGRAGDVPVMGDWNGSGIATPGVVRGGRWLLKNSHSGGAADIEFPFGRPGDVPVVGDWNGDGRDTPGVVRGDRWLLRNSLTGGVADIEFSFGRPGDVPVVGDWNGDGRDTPGVVRGDRWLLRNSLTGGVADIEFSFGRPGDVPVVGDWNDSGRDTAGMVRGGTWYLRNSASSGTADIEFSFGRPGDEFRVARSS